MKRLLCCFLGIALLLSLLTGCGGKPAAVLEGGAGGLLPYLTGSTDEEYLLIEDAELDLTGSVISSERTVLLQAGVSLKLTGVLNPDSGRITFRAGYGEGEKPLLDLSALGFSLDSGKEATIFDIRTDVELIAPQEQERLFVDTSNNEWISIKSVLPEVDEPQEDIQQDDGPQGYYEITTSEEFLELFTKADTEQIALNDNITVVFGKAALTHDVFVICNGHTLTLTGTLNMQGGMLDIGDNPDIENGKVDVSGLTVTCDPDSYPSGTSDILFIGMNFKQIIGEPKLGGGLVYEIPDSGEHASVKLMEVITPEMHEAKLHEDMLRWLSGEDIPGGVGIGTKYLADGVLEINLDNPVIDHEIGVMIDGGMTLILTGSVTFDGGLYAFELARDSSGKATVDITGLKIYGTAALGNTKSPDIFKITGNGVDFKYNESDPHIKVVQNANFWLRYVQ